MYSFAIFLAFSAYLSGQQFAYGINLLNSNTCNKLGSYMLAGISGDCYNDPLVLLDLPSVARVSGYYMETHTVVTPDGYILSLFHIPAKKKGAPPVYLQHGIVTNSACFLDKRKESLAYALADAGFDVWLGNVRGTTYSKGHMHLKPADPEYWNFNLDVLAHNDIPANLQFIANYTGQAGNIAYVGHSMGTTLFFMFASSMPEEAHRLLKGMVALSPVSYLDHHKILHAASPLSGVVRGLLKSITIRGLFTHEAFIHPTTVHICRAVPYLCKGFNELTLGKDDNQYDPKVHLKYFSNWPVGTAVDQLIQYLQIAGSKKVQMFDYGKADNKKKYGQETPPRYNFSKIKMPVYLLHGLNDPLVPVEDVTRLFKELGSEKKKMIEISKENNVKYDHVAFIYGKNNSKFLFPIIIDAIKSTFGLDPSKVPESSQKECK